MKIYIMEDLITKLIQEHFGLAFLIGLLFVSGFIFVIWWARGVYDKTKKIDDLPCISHSQKLDSLTALSTKLDGLPCVDHQHKLENQMDKHSNIESAISKIETSISFMQKSIDGLSQNLQKNRGIITDPFTQRQSPLRITEEGYKVVEQLGILEMVEENWMRIKFFVEENAQSCNPYDIQQFCIEQAVVYPEKFLREDEINKIKMDAYIRGEALSSYMKIIAVLVRDRYFEEHNIDIADIDKHAPKY